MKKRILVTHWDRGISPEIFEIEGDTEKRLILDVYYNSDRIVNALGEDDEFINKVWEAELTEEQLMEKIPFETLYDFLNDLNTKSQYTFNEN